MLDLIYNRLQNDAKITTEVGAEVYPYIREQGQALPAIFIEQSSAQFSETLGKTSHGDEFTFAVFCLSETLSESISLGRLVRDNLDGLNGSFTIGSNSYLVHKCTINELRTDILEEGKIFVTEAGFNILIQHTAESAL
jgi:hypothetical protein